MMNLGIQVKQKRFFHLVKNVEFVNKPNMLKMTGFPKDYTADDFRRGQDIFQSFYEKN